MSSFRKLRCHRDDECPNALDELLDALDDVASSDLDLPMAVKLWAAGLQVPNALAPPIPRPASPPGPRVSSTRLCGYDVLKQGDRARFPGSPCRRIAEFVVRAWLNDLGDLYLCPLHLKALRRRQPHDEIERVRVWTRFDGVEAGKK